MREEDKKWIDACHKAAETKDEIFEFRVTMITRFEEIFDDIVYDWPFDPHEHPKIRKHDDGFEINKTYIIKRDDKFYREYKTDCVEITEEVYKKVVQLYELLYGEEKC